MLTSNGYVLDESPQRLGELVPTPEDKRDDRPALWEQLRRDGYLYLTQHLDPAVVRDFRRYYFSRLQGTGIIDPRADPAIGKAGSGEVDRAKFRHILYDEIIPSKEFSEFCTAPAIRGWFRWFLEDDVHLHKRKIIRHTRPGATGVGLATQAHYDLVYLREGTDRVLSIWIPLGDCPRELGGLTYLENSHHWVLAEEREGRLKRPAASITANLPALADELDCRWLSADYRAGDVVVHSAHTVHAALDNVVANGTMRLSTDIRYQRTKEPIDWRWQQDWIDTDGL